MKKCNGTRVIVAVNNGRLTKYEIEKSMKKLHDNLYISPLSMYSGSLNNQKNLISGHQEVNLNSEPPQTTIKELKIKRLN